MYAFARCRPYNRQLYKRAARDDVFIILRLLLCVHSVTSVYHVHARRVWLQLVLATFYFARRVL